MRKNLKGKFINASAEDLMNLKWLYSNVITKDDFKEKISNGKTIYETLIENRNKKFSDSTMNALVYYEIKTQPPFTSPSRPNPYRDPLSERETKGLSNTF